MDGYSGSGLRGIWCQCQHKRRREGGAEQVRRDGEDSEGKESTVATQRKVRPPAKRTAAVNFINPRQFSPERFKS